MGGIAKNLKLENYMFAIKIINKTYGKKGLKKLLTLK
jgi:hypothetical protein